MTKTFEEDKFFENYSKTKKKQEGVPGLIMNAPFRPRGKTGDIGLELEVEAANNLPRDAQLDGIISPTTKVMWNAKVDGSLRGNAMEYVFNNPVNVDEVAPMVIGLFDAFTKHRTKLANSNRCSTHVHINIGGLTIDQITAILALWTTFEEPLIQWCGEARINNHYSLSAKNSVTMLEAWENFLRTGNTRWPDGLKYSALNILTMHNFGSVEFRCGPAADSPEIAIQWAVFLYNLCKFAKDNYRDLYALPRDLSELGGINLFKNICKEATGLDDFCNAVLKPYSEQDFNEQALVGFRNAQAIVLGFPWDRWSELINREYVPQPFAKKKLVDLGEVVVEVVAPRGRWPAPPPGIPVHEPMDERPDEPDLQPAGLLTIENIRPVHRQQIDAVRIVARQQAERLLRQRYGDRAWPNWEFEEENARQIDRLIRQHRLM